MLSDKDRYDIESMYRDGTEISILAEVYLVSTKEILKIIKSVRSERLYNIYTCKRFSKVRKETENTEFQKVHNIKGHIGEGNNKDYDKQLNRYLQASEKYGMISTVKNKSERSKTMDENQVVTEEVSIGSPEELKALSEFTEVEIKRGKFNYKPYDKRMTEAAEKSMSAAEAYVYTFEGVAESDKPVFTGFRQKYRQYKKKVNGIPVKKYTRKKKVERKPVKDFSEVQLSQCVKDYVEHDSKVFEIWLSNQMTELSNEIVSLQEAIEEKTVVLNNIQRIYKSIK